MTPLRQGWVKEDDARSYSCLLLRKLMNDGMEGGAIHYTF